MISSLTSTMTRINSEPLPIHPPGRIKIVAALHKLLEEKDFNSITTAEIAKTACVTEGLIYKYFKSKRDLLFQALKEQFEQFITQTDQMLKPLSSAKEKLRVIIESYFNAYDQDRVLARMLLLEVRNLTDFFKSDAYKLVQIHSRIILNVIESGIISGEFRTDIKASTIRSTILGAIEHACLSGLIFERSIPTESHVDNICKIVFDGIIKSDR